MAIITISNTGGNWNSTTTWVGGVVPGAADDVVATATSGPLTVNVTSSCKSIVLTNYASTLTLNALLDVFGTVTFVPGMSVAGTNQLRFNTTATLTSGGLTIPWSLLWVGTSQTFTLGDVWNCSGSNSFGGTTSLTINGNQIVSTNTFNIGGSGIAGTTTLVMIGTGAIQGAGIVSCNLIFNSPSGTITIGSSGSPNLRFSTGVLTYSAGTIVYGSVTGGLSVAGSCTLNTSGINWQNVIFNAANTTTLTSSLNVTGTTTIGLATVINGTGTTLNVGGNLTVTQSSSGTANIILNGTGTWSTTAATGIILNNLTINTSGTITISGNVYYNTGTLTYTAGTVITTGSTLNCNASVTFNTNTMVWNNVSFFTNSLTVTLSSNFNMSGTLTFSYTASSSVSFSAGANIFNPTGSLVVNSGSNGFTLTLPNSISVTNATLGNANGTFSLNSNTMNVSGNLTIQTTVGGTTNIVMNGSGTFSANANGVLNKNLTFNTSGNISITGGIVYNGTVTYTSGTISASGSTLVITSSATFNTNGMSWGSLTIISGVNVTLSSNLTLLQNLQIGNGGLSPNSLNGAFVLFVGGNFTLTGNAGNNYNVSGAATITMNGTGSFTMTNFIIVDVNFTIDTLGTFTLAGTLGFRTGTLTYVKGDVISSGGTLYLVGSNINTTLNTSGVSWSSVLIYGTQPITLLSDFNADTLRLGLDDTLLNNSPIPTTVTFTGSFRLKVNLNLFVGYGRYTLLSNASATVTLNLPNPISVPTLSVRLSSGRNTLFQASTYDAIINNHSVTVLKNIDILITSTGLGNSPTLGGTSEIIMKGDTWLARGATANSSAIDTIGLPYNYSSPITIDSSLLSISTNMTTYPNFIYNTTRTFKYLNGIVKTNLPLQLGTGPTLINMNKIIWNGVTVTSGINVTMNEFFSGSATKPIRISASTTSNYTITFQDNLEKFSKFVRVSNATTTVNNQLTVLTRNGNAGNNVGIKFYSNQRPNGFAKNSPSIPNSPTFGFGGILSDPIFT